MSELSLEIIEGPGAGRTVAVERALVIGRGEDADLTLEDPQASRLHARVTPSPRATAIVEDLGSSNGTFINHAELIGPAELRPGDELLVGVTLLELRSAAQRAAVPSAVRQIPPGLATPNRRPAFTDQKPPELSRELNRLRDSQVRLQARLAPLAVLVLAALVVAVYLASR